MKVDSKILLEMIDEEIENLNEGKKIKDDHEGRMAKSELRDMIKNGLILYKLIDKEDELPGWASSYITLASDYMHSVMEYMVEGEQDEDEGDEEEEENEDEEEDEEEEEDDEGWQIKISWYSSTEVGYVKKLN